ncbi:hypothetical protein LMG23994_07171 [Cupriavidus pinatubonensis]|uniref:Core-binding (CB) domain-containing protein n=1 Tax=Cupriavidus pinatubonensis TaxID=248026 RepID=A0ABM8Y4L6_9BURK|nr:hypothetical protein LMG23994_07171 [Cupriavidus pinatubonensis]
MSKKRSHSSSSNFATLLQEFFVERLIQQRAASPQTIASYRDTFRLFLQFAQARLRKSPVDLALSDITYPSAEPVLTWEYCSGRS